MSKAHFLQNGRRIEGKTFFMGEPWDMVDSAEHYRAIGSTVPTLRKRCYESSEALFQDDDTCPSSESALSSTSSTQVLDEKMCEVKNGKKDAMKFTTCYKDICNTLKTPL